MTPQQQDAVTKLTHVLQELRRFDDEMPVIHAMLLAFVAERDRGPGTGASGKETSEHFGLGADRVSRNLKVLAASGLVVRRNDNHGSRRNRLSPAGAYLVARLVDLMPEGPRQSLRRL